MLNITRTISLALAALLLGAPARSEPKPDPTKDVIEAITVAVV